MRPDRALLAGLVGALGDEQVGVPGQLDGVVAHSGIRAVGHDLAVQVEPVAQARRSVHQELALQGEGNLVRPGG